jgi:chemotaxis signal transduction protein
MSARALDMRRAFDAAFAQPVSLDRREELPALVVALGASRWVIRLRDIAGVARGRPPLPVPGASPSLLGLTGVRGMLVPVYSLAALLGLAEGPKVESRWLALVSHGGTLGLAFDGLVRHEQLAAEHMHFAPDGSAVCHFDDEHLPMVDVGAVLASIVKGTHG